MKASCNCKHAGQDKLHGQGTRVFNGTPKKAPDGQVLGRCSICGTERNIKKV